MAISTFWHYKRITSKQSTVWEKTLTEGKLNKKPWTKHIKLNEHSI